MTTNTQFVSRAVADLAADDFEIREIELVGDKGAARLYVQAESHRTSDGSYGVLFVFEINSEGRELLYRSDRAELQAA